MISLVGLRNSCNGVDIDQKEKQVKRIEGSARFREDHLIQGSKGDQDDSEDYKRKPQEFQHNKLFSATKRDQLL